MARSVVRARSIRALVRHPEREELRAGTLPESVVELVIDRGLTSGKLDLYVVDADRAVELATDLLDAVRNARKVNADRAARGGDR